LQPTDIRNPDYFHKVVDCQWACPAHTPVPEYIRLIAQGRYGDAYMVNWKSNVFPGILGRTCDRPCEPACRRGRVEEGSPDIASSKAKPEPVAICRLKRVAADFKEDIRDRLPRPASQRNGKRVALVRNGGILVFDVKTQIAIKLTSGPVDTQPAWSSDGKRIAFTSRSDPKAELAIFVMNADGSGRRQLSHFAAGSGNAQWPVWSPNGHQLAIQVNRSQEHNADIWILDARTGDAHKVSAHDQPYLDETPSWFPDGKRIAFQSNRTGNIEVCVMNADGSGARQITR
jgi:hypothetical protein